MVNNARFGRPVAAAKDRAPRSWCGVAKLRKVDAGAPHKQTGTPVGVACLLGAEDGIRTRDPHLGKSMVIDMSQGLDQHLSSSGAICDLRVIPFNTPKYPSFPVNGTKVARQVSTHSSSKRLTPSRFTPART
jgi:hypothetical protein